MPRKTNRRRFLQTSAATGVGFWVAGNLQAQESKSPNEKIRFACIGVGGKGSSDSGDAGRHGDVVAICDVDEKRLDVAANRFPKAKKFTDYRQLLDEMADGIDAVTVSTPDHSHAPAALRFMRAGKHAFCQKPLTHTIYEARLMGEVAKEKNLVTQMGNQGTAGAGLRQAAATVQEGVLGDVTEAHIWTNRPVWPQEGERMPESAELPEGVHWDLWLGPASERHYVKDHHPFAWRGWWDFGTGALGDMACHTFNLPFMALNLRDPVSVVADTTPHNKVSYPKSSTITFQFPALGNRQPVKVVWYDGGRLPSADLLDGKPVAESGSLIIGSKGKLYSPGDYGADYQLLGIEQPDVEFKKAPPGGHFTEWVNGIKGGDRPVSNFTDYSGPLTETMLLGNLAVYAGGKVIEWDAKNLVATNAPEVEKVIRKDYREGFGI